MTIVQKLLNRHMGPKVLSAVEGNIMKVALLLLSLVLCACGQDPKSDTAIASGTGTATIVPQGPAPVPSPGSTGPVYTQQYEITWSVSVAPGVITNYVAETLVAPRQYTMPAMNQITDGTNVTPGETIRVTLYIGDTVTCTYTRAFGDAHYSYYAGSCPTAGDVIDVPVGKTITFQLFDNGNTATRTVTAHTTYLE